MLISANRKCSPVLAILDDDKVDLSEIMNHPEKEHNYGFLTFLDMALSYNINPDDFGVELPVTRASSVVVDEVIPKVKVAWGQGSPFNKYTPNNYPVGCVAVAAAQAFTVTRHINGLNGIKWNYDELIKVKDWSFASTFEIQANTVALLMREIGKVVRMKYAAGGSGADSATAIKRLFTDFGLVNMTKNKARIHATLKDFSGGIVYIESWTKTNNWLGVPRGSGHVYLADGYRIFADGSDLIHVNYGWGPGYNGYYLTCLSAPYFTPDAEYKYPHAWTFYCLTNK